MNACSFIGRILPGFVVHKVGAGNIEVVFTFISAATIIGMIGLSSVGSVVVIAVIYGVASGVCEYPLLGLYCATLK